MDMAARTGAWRPIGAPLPYDTEVEWLRASNGNDAHIDTGIVPNDNTGMSITYNLDYLAANEIIAGVRENGLESRFTFGNSSRSAYAGWNFPNAGRDLGNCNVGDKIRSSLNVYNDRKAVHLNLSSGENASGSVSGNLYNQFTRSIWIIRCNWMGLPFSTGVTLSVVSAKITVSMNDVFDAIPVRFTNENGVSEGAMYDRVSGQLFRNQGTGAFVIGPDKVGTELAGGGINA